MQSRRYCYTINNYSSADEFTCQRITGTKYHVYGRETAPTTGTRHLQGFIVFTNGRRFTAIKNVLPGGAHIEAARGTSKEASDYCKKTGDFWETGTCPIEKGEGEKERWKRAREAAEAGRFEDIDDDIYIRYYGNLKKISNDKQKRPEAIEDLDFHWYYGDTGTGKSSKARSENPNYYLKGINKWWDGFENQDCVIIEEWGPMEPGAERAMGHYLKQ